MTRATGRPLLIAATIAVAAAVSAGLWALGSPATQRQQRLDATRIEDLTVIERAIATFAGLHKSLPHDLPSLAREPGFSVRIDDPESGAPYAYEILDTNTYRLCATFKTRSEDAAPYRAYGPATFTAWAHATGRQCFNAKLTAYDKAR
jgi:hypothetical protein